MVKFWALSRPGACVLFSKNSIENQAKKVQFTNPEDFEASISDKSEKTDKSLECANLFFSE
jgi:hypothetical protein